MARHQRGDGVLVLEELEMPSAGARIYAEVPLRCDVRRSDMWHLQVGAARCMRNGAQGR